MNFILCYDSYSITVFSVLVSSPLVTDGTAGELTGLLWALDVQKFMVFFFPSLKLEISKMSPWKNMK